MAREHQQCDRDYIGDDCRCSACEERKIDAAEYAREAMEEPHG
jgi:hypothetical protein